MKKFLFSRFYLVVLFLIVLVGGGAVNPQKAEAAPCPSGKECAVFSPEIPIYGIPKASGGGHAFFSDNLTAEHICQLEGYQSLVSRGDKYWDSCTDEHLTRWTGSTWDTQHCNFNFDGKGKGDDLEIHIDYIYCARPIPPPTSFTTSCSSSSATAASANFTWSLPSGYSLSYLRLWDNGTGGPGAYGTYTGLIPETSTSGSPFNLTTVIPGHNYTARVHTRLANGSFSTELQSSFNCAVPIVPSCSTTTYGCTSGTSANNTLNTSNWTWNCNGSGGASVSCSKTIPPPTSISASCPLPGSNATISWSLPSGYSDSYLRIKDNTTGGGSVNLVPEISTSNPYNYSTTAGHSYTASAYTRIINPSGYSYSDAIERTFSCASATLPTVTTGSISNITTTTATGSGTVTSDGGADVTVSGIAWGTGVNPTIAGTHDTEGWEMGGPWTSYMSGLSSSQTYHVRAYATNSAGTAYGADVSFTTLPAPVNGGWTDWGPTSSCSTACGQPASTLSRSCTNPTPANGGTSCSGSPTQSCLATPRCLNPIDGACAETHYGCDSPEASTHPIPDTSSTWNWTCPGTDGGSGSGCSEAKPIPPMIGSLNPSSSSCVIAFGQSSCNVSLSWMIQNPEAATTSITASGMTNVNVTSTKVSPQSGTRSLSVPYDARTFYLYNNGKLLGQADATSACTDGARWNGTICAPMLDGGWTPWSSWSSCSVTACGSAGIQTATRSCTSPAPTNGGKLCTDSTNPNFDNMGASKTQPCSTAACPGLPVVVTGSISNITHTTATARGTVTSNGGANVTVSGIAWGTGVNPTVAGPHDTEGWEMGGPWTSYMSGLTAGQTYHVRAYATNNVGTSYGADVAFTTLVMVGTLNPSTPSCVIDFGQSSCNVSLSWSITNPEVAPASITASGMTNANVTSTTASPQSGTRAVPVPYDARSFYFYNNGKLLNGPVNATSTCTSGARWNGTICAPMLDGGWTPWSPWSACTVTACSSSGIQTSTRTCTSPAPTNGGKLCTDSTNPNFDNAGASRTQSCSTMPCPGFAVVTTSPITNITFTTATGGGTISSNGGAAVTASGIAWGTSPNPTIGGLRDTEGWSIGGPWSSYMAGLSSGTTYHVRAYATNNVGTSYGADVAFTTLVMVGTLNPSTPSCVIDFGQSSCNVNLSWMISNPEATVTSITASGITNVDVTSTKASPQSGTRSVYVPYDARDFYFYNNAKLLSGPIKATSTCTSGARWNGTICAPMLDGGWTPWSSWSSCSVTSCGLTGVQTSTRTCTSPAPTNGGKLCTDSTNPNFDNAGASRTQPCSTAACGVMSGTLNPSNPSCVIASGASSCNVTLSWNVTLAETTPASITASGMSDVNVTSTTASPQSGTRSVPVPYDERTFYLYDHGKLLSQITATSDCDPGNRWNGSSCQPIMSGSCLAAHYTCSSPLASTNNVNGPSSWTWTCPGSNGGTPMSCSETKPTSPVTIPTIVTVTPITNITQTSATGTGRITSNGGGTITQAGIVWGTSANPTTADSKTTDEWEDTGDWTNYMAGLLPNTNYHVRAYATNSAGTAYGADVKFKTSATPVVVNGGWSAWSDCSVTACGLSGTQTRTCTLPPLANGGKACTDPTNPNYDGLGASKPCSTEACETFSDLTAARVTPTVATTGIAESYYTTISNTGSGSAAGVITHLFQYDDDTNHSSGVTTGTSQTTTTLIPSSGAGISNSHTFSTSGNKYVRVCADNNASFAGIIYESDETNNCGPWTTVVVTNAPAVNVAPVVTNATINPKPINPNGSSQYSIVVTASDANGGADVASQYAMVNYQGVNSTFYRGYIGWSTSGFPQIGGTTNLIACTGGGTAGKSAQVSYGSQYINLVSCSTSVFGSSRTTTFVVSFNSNFTAPTTNNTLSSWAADSANTPDSWRAFETFGISSTPLPCTAPLTQNVTVSCDLNSLGQAAISGSVTRSQTKSAYPSCAFGTPVTNLNSTYVSDNCVYPTSAVSMDLKVNGGDYSTAQTALQVAAGQTLNFTWSSIGNSGRTCSATSGQGVTGWAQASIPISSLGLIRTAPVTSGTYQYSATCQQDTALGKADQFISFFVSYALAAIISDTDSVFVQVTPVAINGACGELHYDCALGSSVNNVETSTNYTWGCNGINGGSPASPSCSEAKVVPPPPGPSSGGLIIQGGGGGLITTTEGDPVTLTWSSDAATCTVRDSTGTSLISDDGVGALEVTPTSDTTYTIICNGGSAPSGGYTDTWTVSVKKKPKFIEQ